jgi:MFS family permease
MSASAEDEATEDEMTENEVAADQVTEVPAPGRPAAGQVTQSLFRNPDYLGWWTGNSISALGSSVSSIAYPLLVLFATGSVAKAGLISSAQLIGLLVSSLWGGALADRVSRRAILMTGPLVQAAILGAVAGLVGSGHVAIGLLALAAMLSGIASGAVLGASTPALRKIVPKERLPSATGQAMGRDLAADLIGSPLGGLLFAITRWLPFAADAVSFGFASLGAALIRTPLGPDRSAAPAGTTMLQEVTAGIRFIVREPFLRFVTIWASLASTISEAFVLLIMALVKYRGGGPAEIGVVASIALVGGIAGAVLAPPVAKRIRARLVMYLAGWAFVATVVLVAWVRQPWQIGLIVFFTMGVNVPLNVVLEAYEVRLVPDRFSGRVSAAGRFGVYGLQWTGPLIAGLLAVTFGVPGAILALAVALVPLVLSLHVTRSLRILNVPVDQVVEASSDEIPAAGAQGGNSAG